VKTEGGDCPGGLSTEEWNSVEGTYSCMSTEAAGRTRQLLFAGNIRGAALAPDKAGVVIPLIPNAIYINRSSSRGNIFFDSQLGPTLVHEGRHVDQFAGMSGQQAAQFYSENGGLLELDAALYEEKNHTCARQP
jgi:hypothetical protein